MSKLHHERGTGYREGYGSRRGERVRVVSVYARNMDEAKRIARDRHPDETIIRVMRNTSSAPIGGKTNYLVGTVERRR